MDYGADPDAKVIHIRKNRDREAIPYGGTDEPADPPRRVKRPAAAVTARMNELWPRCTTTSPEYFGFKCTDAGAFNTYLNRTFFDDDAKTPLPVESVLRITEMFMDDVYNRRVVLKQGQPVWKAFTHRWQNYELPLPVDPTKTVKWDAKAYWAQKKSASR